MADFVIIGGGGYGTGTAWELARRGADVHLIEAESIASGASGGLGKRGVRANGRDVRELPLMRRAYDLWPTLQQRLGDPVGYERTGHLLLMERDNDIAHGQVTAWMQNQQSIPTQSIKEGQLRDMEPNLGPAVKEALFCPLDGIADHTATTRAYAQAAAAHGAIIEEQNPVTGLERDRERVTAVITQNGIRIPVEKAVLLLSNAHVPPFLDRQMGVALPVWLLLPQVMLTTPISPSPINHLIGHAHRTLAMKMVGDQIMISGGWHGRENPATHTCETLPDQIEGNRSEAVAVYPMLAGIGLQEVDASRREMISVDSVPIIDRIDNLIYATGWSGHGWAILPAVVELLAEWALTGARPRLLAPFAYSRFQSG